MLNRIVSIFCLSAALVSDESFKSRFMEEARAAASVRHPNIVTIHEIAEHSGRPYIAMEYIEGRSLQDLIDRGPSPAENVITIILQLCAGLKAAHDAQIIHRDIKPANILLDDNRDVRILDFGLARPMDGTDLSRSGTTAGTVAYMSPEQVRGEKLTAASDLFSVGIVMYHALTGQRPFEGEYEAAVMYSIANESPKPIRELAPDIAPDLEKVVSKLLDRDPSRRYQTADAVMEDLGKLTVSNSSQVSRVEPPTARRRLVPLVGLILIITLVAVGFMTLYTPESQPDGDRPMLAVLPFENLGPAEDEYFADGITDAVTLHLAKFGSLGVISRKSSMLYKSSEMNSRQVGDELGVDYLLTGTIHWDKSVGNRVRINTALVNAEDDSYIWTDSYDREMEKIFDLQSEIARKVTGALNVAIPRSKEQALRRPPTLDLEAYDFYLRGNDYFNRSWRQEDIAIAIDMYKRAIERDSTFALAWAMLSRGHASLYWEYYDHTEEQCRSALNAADRALKLRDDLLEGYLALGYYHYHCALDYEAALGLFEQGLDIQPNHADLVNAVAAVQRRQGRLQESLGNFQTALQLDPRSHLKAFDVGLTLGMMRMYEQAQEYLKRATVLTPDYALAYIYRAWLPILEKGDVERARTILAEVPVKTDLTSSKYYWWLRRILGGEDVAELTQITPGTDSIAYFLYLAQGYRLKGNLGQERLYSDSARLVTEEKLLSHPDDARFHSSLALAFAGLRERDKALFHGQRALELLPVSREAFDAPFLILNFAEVMMVFEEYDRAVEQLRYLLSIPGFVSPAYLKLDPLWAPLQHRPAFQKLLQEAS